MRIGNAKRSRGAGILEKAGLAAFLGGFADLFALHRAAAWADVIAIVVGLTFLISAVIMTPDDV